MRAVGLSDLDAAARALLAAPQLHWAQLAAQMIEEAHLADLYRKRFGVAHPGGGTGSLYVQAGLLGPVAASTVTPHYARALRIVLEALEAWRGRLEGG